MFVHELSSHGGRQATVGSKAKEGVQAAVGWAPVHWWPGSKQRLACEVSVLNHQADLCLISELRVRLDTEAVAVALTALVTGGITAQQLLWVRIRWPECLWLMGRGCVSGPGSVTG